MSQWLPAGLELHFPVLSAVSSSCRAELVTALTALHAPFPVQPSRPKLSRFFILGVLRRSEAEVLIESHALIHVRRKDVEVVNPQRSDTAIEAVFLVHRLQPLHVPIELDRNAVIVADAQGAALEGTIYPLRSDALSLKVVFGTVEVVVIPDFVGRAGT